MSELANEIYPNLECLGSADRYIDDIVEIIDHIKLFEDFSTDELNVLCHHMRCYAAPRDCTLLEEGVDGDFLLLILSGSVNVTKLTLKHEIKVIAEANAGDTLGEMSLIDGRPRFASCRTNTPADFAMLTRDSLNEILVHHPRLGNKILLVLLQLMSVRLRESCDRFLPSVYSGII